MATRAANSARINVRGALREGMARLREANVPSHALAAELLLMHALGRDRTWMYANPEAAVDAAAAEKFFTSIARRAAGTPTQYLTGRQEFWGLEFEVTPAVLIPRPETEHVVEVALERLGAEGANARLNIADVGTGSGCIAVALAKELPQAEIFATDVSAEALEVARRNAERHAVEERVRLVECNLLVGAGETAGQLDLIVSNPPYVARDEAAQLPREVREHEPHAALFAGPSGAEIYEALTAQAAKRLRRGGLLVVEIGYGALERVRPLFNDPQVWTNIRVTNDLAGIPRVISAARV
ncbi:MAG TPA: peptide chain release factor N(5)-glutamine methyltransferase [Candidatus Acidoferrales bacterium]|nr:peptide chain release factor N(5)-glutamine methyltransferase [Candidatus Acidoferrales bacterium]